jgi:multidrug/hemolysin transport system ATP-binding protein
LGLEYKPIGEGFKLTLKNTAVATELIINNPKLFVDYEVTKGKMDDVFLSVTGKKLSEDN